VLPVWSCLRVVLGRRVLQGGVEVQAHSWGEPPPSPDPGRGRAWAASSRSSIGSSIASATRQAVGSRSPARRDRVAVAGWPGWRWTLPPPARGTASPPAPVPARGDGTSSPARPAPSRVPRPARCTPPSRRAAPARPAADSRWGPRGLLQRR
jgi:hypothetical protein